ncbi:MAG TPA: hypothetical protein PKL31_12600 [Fulvivirga sp.]|nr:hypothetical protein [Fulvivirga sp.]
MKNLSFLLLLIWGCSDPNTAQQMAGVWSIEWSTESESRLGVLVLNEDHTGHFSVAADTNSLLLPLESSTRININWHQADSLLTITRPDNNVILIYHIKASGKDLIDMKFAEDIDVRLIRK